LDERDIWRRRPCKKVVDRGRFCWHSLCMRLGHDLN
jgi:hypothetical protein